MTNEAKKEVPEKGRTASGRSTPRQAGEKKGTRGGYRGPKKAAAERQPAESARTGKEKEKKEKGGKTHFQKPLGPLFF